MKIIKIKSCSECPYSSWGQAFCFKAENCPSIPDEMIIPDFCPLEDAP